MDAAKSTCHAFDTPPFAEPDSEDLQLIERAQANDETAFDTLAKKYREKVYSIVYNLTSNKDDAFDVTQDVLIKAFQSIGKFNGRSAFFTWLYRIAVNTTISFIRKNKSRKFFSFEKIQEDGMESLCSEDIFFGKEQSDRPIFLQELQENLNIALQKLSNKHRVVVVLYEIEGLDHMEIASILKCSVGTVRSRLHYAKEQLKNFLRDYIQ